jgi:hypothetical protein
MGDDHTALGDTALRDLLDRLLFGGVALTTEPTAGIVDVELAELWLCPAAPAAAP